DFYRTFCYCRGTNTTFRGQIALATSLWLRADIRRTLAKPQIYDFARVVPSFRPFRYISARLTERPGAYRPGGFYLGRSRQRNAPRESHVSPGASPIQLRLSHACRHKYRGTYWRIGCYRTDLCASGP